MDARLIARVSAGEGSIGCDCGHTPELCAAYAAVPDGMR